MAIGLCPRLGSSLLLVAELGGCGYGGRRGSSPTGAGLFAGLYAGLSMSCHVRLD